MEQNRCVALKTRTNYETMKTKKGSRRLPTLRANARSIPGLIMIEILKVGIDGRKVRVFYKIRVFYKVRVF